MNSDKIAKRVFFIVGLLLCSGCCQIKMEKGGFCQLLMYEGKRITCSAHKAIKDDYLTLGLTASGLLFTIDDFDEKASNWMTKHNPVMGSEKAADDYSDYARNFLIGEAALIAGVVFFDNPNDQKRWREIAAVETSAGLTYGLTKGFKRLFDRQRPDKSNDRSLPSGHSSASFAAAEIANRNLFMNEKWPRYINYAIAGSVAWGRVEAKKHYPKDVLLGAALGRFLTNFVYEYCELPKDKFGLEIIPTNEGIAAQLAFYY